MHRIRTAARAAAWPVTVILAMIVIASTVVALQAQGVSARVDEAVTGAVEDARRDTAAQYEAEVANLRDQLSDFRDARDACYEAADEATSPIYGYFADTDNQRDRYHDWLPMLDECRTLAGPQVEHSEGDGPR